MPITEPITMLTDYAIALQTSGFSILLFKLGFRRQLTVQFWAAAFGSVAIAAVLGGTCHGFTLLLEPSTLMLLWRIMLFALSFAGCFMLFATLKSSLSRQGQKWASLLVGIKLLAYLSWTALHPSLDNAFVYGVIDYLSAMLWVLLLELRAIFHSTLYRSLWIIAGILMSGIAIALQISGLVLFEYFNYNDLYHLAQMIALYWFYRGARLLKDR
jgi:hypothetical protein